MNRDQITRDDFPDAQGGYDRASVDAHLAAVAAWTAALEAQIAALEVEREALRRSASQSAGQAAAAIEEPPVTGPPAPPEPAAVGGRLSAEPAPGNGGESGGKSEFGADGDSGEDEVSARLMATRLALEGREPDEIVASLAETYELADPEALVADVLERLE